jgi:uncharacterized protein
MSNSTSIRDPIHNYIYLTYVEENVVEHRLFQRLRFISQNGSAYYTYPSNRHCRFLHSLGVMKLGGDIFLSATEDLNDPDVRAFLINSYNYISKLSSKSVLSMDSIMKSFFHKKNIAYIKYGLDIDTNIEEMRKELKKNESSIYVLKFTRLILFQSLRLACLLHDIGHFPYSHTVEYAFKEYLGSIINDMENKSEDINPEKQNFIKDYQKMKAEFQLKTDTALHELIGIKILEEILPSEVDDFQKICRILSRLIITNEDKSPILQTLHEVVSGELDADRLDYSLRDPYSSGLELGTFDIERLLNNFIVFQEDNKFKILPKKQSLSSIECFFHQRYLAYKYLIYHHSKVRMDLIIKEITSLLIYIYFEQKKEHSTLIDILKKNNFEYLWSKINNSPINHKENYFLCDENWYKNLLNEIFENRHNINDSDSSITKLKILIETFTLRKTNNIISILKRYDKYLGFFEKIFEALKTQDICFNEVKKDCIEIFTNKYTALKEFTSIIYGKYGVIILYTDTQPKSLKFKDNNSLLTVVNVEGQDKSCIPVNKLSPYIESLKVLNKEDQQFHIFFISKNLKDQQELVTNLNEELINFISQRILERKQATFSK